jgi:putative NADPH-quinone reductase
MKISIILAHPNPGSFNHAIANVAADTLRRNDHQVILHDLCQEQFPLLLSALSRRRSGSDFGIRISDLLFAPFPA